MMKRANVKPDSQLIHRPETQFAGLFNQSSALCLLVDGPPSITHRLAPPASLRS